MSGPKGFVGLSKGKYYELESKLKDEFGEAMTEKVLSNMREVFNFDPNQTTATAAAVERTRKYRAKLKEQGISTYISSGSKKQYEKKKGGVPPDPLPRVQNTA